MWPEARLPGGDGIRHRLRGSLAVCAPSLVTSLFMSSAQFLAVLFYCLALRISRVGCWLAMWLPEIFSMSVACLFIFSVGS